MTAITYTGGRIFDGVTLHETQSARFEGGVFDRLIEPQNIQRTDQVIDLKGAILSPGYVDLQVNGGDGIMLNADPSVATLLRMAQAHRRLGATRILPTLITDTPTKTLAAIKSTQDAISRGIPGIAGLHLEGPHLSIARRGAHEAQFIRPMDDSDLQTLIAAKAHLPILKVTIAPESVTTDQVVRMAQAGILISLGHTDTDFDTCLTYAKAGARCVTHLFNAMSQLANRAPGVVGAAIDCGALSAGIIADGIHVHPAALRMLWAAKAGPGSIYLVSDAMAVAGTDLTAFELGGRVINRKDGQLRLEDGTLAGADLDLTRAINVLVNQVGVRLEQALTAATRTPAEICGLRAHLETGISNLKDLILISSDLTTATPLQADI